MPPRGAAHKRANSEKDSMIVASKRARRRVSGRMSGMAKASYAESSEEAEFDDMGKSSDSLDEDKTSEFEDDEQNDDADEDEASSEIHSDASSGEQASNSRRASAGKRRNLHRTPQAHGKLTSRLVPRSKELQKPGVTTGLEPGTQVVMRKPKPRSGGRIPYEEHIIHPNTLIFLGELAANNRREWLKMNDPDYRASLKDFTSFVETASEKIIEVDDTIPELPTKDIIMRIYRDVRFSKDPTPYKTAFAACWSRTGRKGPFAKYYMQIKPGGSMLGPNEHEVVAAFVRQNKGDALKTKPKGFDSDHKEIDLLRLKSFVVKRDLRDEQVTNPAFLGDMARLFGDLVPFVTYLNSVVMPDDDGQDGSSDEDDED